MTLLLILFVTSGIVLIGVSIPLIHGRIPPNRWYGFRVPATLNHPEIWYPANTYAAWRMLWTGVAMLVASVAAYLTPGMTPDIYGYIMIAVIVLCLAIALFQSFAYLGRLKQEAAKSEANESNA